MRDRATFSAGLAAFLLLLAPSPARAAGGAHIVDDAAVETPGHCHLETWLTGLDHGRRLAVAVPACTPMAAPDLELGGMVQHGWGDGARATDAGLAAKLQLRPEERGLGLAVTGAVALDVATGRTTSALVNVPLTIPVGKTLSVNLNAGGAWTRGQGWAATTGAQAELRPNERFELMIETFARTRGKAGLQAGPRWTVDKGRVDLDLLLARYPDGRSRDALTIGVTIRR